MKTKYTKNNWMHFTLALSLMGALATAAHAESFSAEVPFAFQAAGKSFAAGAYIVDSDPGRRHHDPQRDLGRGGCTMMASPGALADIPKAGHGLRKKARTWRRSRA